MWLPESTISVSPLPRLIATYLNSSATRSDESLDGRCPISTGEFLLLSLASLDNGYGQEIRVDSRVQIENFVDLSRRFFLRRPRGVPFLPEKFSCA